MDLKYISDSEDCLEEFNRCCDAMVNSKFIIAERRIRDILKSIAASSKLISIFAYCTEGYSFSYEFDRNVAVIGTEKTLRMPSNARDFLAFSYALLMEIDLKSIDFHKLLTEYYYNPDGPNESYKFFTASVIMPFRMFVNELFYEDFIPDVIRQSAV